MAGKGRDGIGSGRLPLGRIVRLVLRELRSGLGGFRVFIACVALGVMVITAVGALSDALRGGLERQGQSILGGDATFSRTHARASDEERRWLAARGVVSEAASMRTMARSLDGSESALAELKAVDESYPLAGRVELGGGKSLAETIHQDRGAAVEPILLERLGVAIGDQIRIGEATVTVTATIASEPDGLSDRLTYGPRVLLSLPTLQATGLVKPGTLVRWRYGLLLPDGGRAEALAALRTDHKRDLAESGFIVLDRRDPSPQISRSLERLRQFLTLLGLTALLVGGVGVASAVATFVDRRRKVIATYKSLGASSRMVQVMLLTQVMAMAAVGVGIGLALGYLVPVVLDTLYGSALPIRAEISVAPASALIAAAYGFLVALLFTLWPLGRAEQVSPAVLFRDQVGEAGGWPPRAVLIASALVALVLAALALVTSDSKLIAGYFLIGIVGVLAIFLGLGTLVTLLARRAPRVRSPELALAIRSIGAPGGLARTVVLSLGTGLSLLVAVALTDASLVKDLTETLPRESPNYFLLDVGKEDYPALVDTIRARQPEADVASAPMLRGRLVKLGDRPVEQIKAPPEAQWVLNGDRGLSYSDTVPEGSRVKHGSWWPADYAGEPLVSFEAELAEKLGVAIGDTVTVNVLGRNVTARIANVREVNWESLAINFVMVFSPNTLAGAPHNLLATVRLPPGATLAAEADVARDLGRRFPTVTAIRVKDAINAFGAVFAKVMTAVRVAGGVTLLAGALVLAGALATAERRRILEAVILKALGATRRRILAAHLLEYIVLTAATVAFAVALGALASWVALEQVMDSVFTFSPRAVLEALGLALGLILALGGLGTWKVLKARPVAYLKAE